MSASITPIKHVITNCSRCNTWITDGQQTVTITVTEERWSGLRGEVAEVQVANAKVALLFCRRCSQLYDFSKVAVGRHNTQADELLIELAEEAEIEGNREAAALDLKVTPERLSAEQIKGWIFEQQYNELEAEGFFDELRSGDPQAAGAN